jgi:selenide, water dikinase
MCNLDKVRNGYPIKTQTEIFTSKQYFLFLFQKQTDMEPVKLTQYSHGAGCGCKISPKVLSTILHSNIEPFADRNLLVGNASRDDAAVYDLGYGTALISTTDFFMPIVDDPFTFGKIAATNAISDVYAMGGKPILAIAILGWPVDKLAPEIAREVLEGARQTCREAGISLAGGHSIDSPEPIFGLAVNGLVHIKNLKRNDTATEGCLLYLTKPLGVGILTTAQKKGILKHEHSHIAPEIMVQLNTIGLEMAGIAGVKAMTDVTGFSLLGHLSEMCEGSGLSAIVSYEKIPLIPGLQEYIDQKSIPGGTFRNWEAYGAHIVLEKPEYKFTLCDPQTSGGLLIAIEPGSKGDVEYLLRQRNMPLEPLGYMTKQTDKLITVLGIA